MVIAQRINHIGLFKMGCLGIMVQVGQDLEVRILRVDTGERKIGLSRKSESKETEATSGTTEGDASAAAPAQAKPREELKGGTGSGAGPLFSLGGSEE